MNVSPDTQGKDFWGRYGWAVIHTFAAMAQTPDQITQYTLWMSTLPAVIPCQSMCGPHLKENLEKMPLQKYLEMKKTPLEWSYVLHDEVNRQNGKPSPALSVVMTYYRPARIQKYVFFQELLWAFVHSIAYHYQPERREDMIRFVALTGLLLPDPIPRQRWIDFTNRNELKLYLHSIYDLFYYTYMLHVYVDQPVGDFTLSIGDLTQFYRHRFGPPSGGSSDAEKKECPSCT